MGLTLCEVFVGRWIATKKIVLCLSFGVKARNEALGINGGHNVTGGGGRDHHCSCNQCIQKELNNKAEEINR